ncbi:MAG: hypothetical protein ACYTG6_04360, partial [Planctomycetota bacterium]|jgi:hypothetical protein
MRPRTVRRVLWYLNGGLALVSLGVASWSGIGMRSVGADGSYVRPAWALDAVAWFADQPADGRRALDVPVTREALDEMDPPVYRTGHARWHVLYTGPLPPDHAPSTTDTPVAPPREDIRSIGRLLMALYQAPPTTEAVAVGSIVTWRFPSGQTGFFSPGEFIREPGSGAPERFLLLDLVRDGRDAYRLLYEVRDDPVWRAELPFTSPPRLPADVERRLRVSGEPEDAPPAASPPTTHVAPSAVSLPPIASLRPEIRPEPDGRTRVVLDDASYDYFRLASLEQLGAGVKTREERDRDGSVVGLRIIGLDADSALSRFFVRAGDILVSIDGHPVGSRSDVFVIAESLGPDTTAVTLVIDRAGRLLTVVIDPTDARTRRSLRSLGTRDGRTLGD